MTIQSIENTARAFPNPIDVYRREKDGKYLRCQGNIITPQGIRKCRYVRKIESKGGTCPECGSKDFSIMNESTGIT